MKLIKNILIAILLILSSTAIAQDKDKHFNIEEMHARKWQSLITQAQLTPKEIDAVKPVFMEYEQLVWKLHEVNHDFFKSAFKNAKHGKPNFAVLNDRYVDNEIRDAQMFKNYHLKLRKLLQPETLFNYYRAERDFKRKLLQDFQDHKPHDKN
jgi:hypothetical protein